MVANDIHILGIVPGSTTGWCLFTVPRLSIFGDEPGELLKRDYGVFDGPEPAQAEDIARLTREVQSLDYKLGPAVLVEYTTVNPADLSPVRVSAMLKFLHFHGKMGDSTLTAQSRSVAQNTMNDDRLRKSHLFVANDHIADATRNALTGLRRANEDADFAALLWPYAAEVSLPSRYNRSVLYSNGTNVLLVGGGIHLHGRWEYVCLNSGQRLFWLLRLARLPWAWVYRLPWHPRPATLPLRMRRSPRPRTSPLLSAPYRPRAARRAGTATTSR
jgi:hypothetical protein